MDFCGKRLYVFEHNDENLEIESITLKIKGK